MIFTKRFLQVLYILLCFTALSYTKAAYGQSQAWSVRNGTSDPAACQVKSLNVFFNTTSGALKVCTAANTWTSTGGSSFTNQSANLIFAGPATGAAAAPTFRVLTAADFPATLNLSIATLAVTPGSDVITAAFRRNGAAQTSNLVEFQTEGNAALSAITKTGAFTGNAATATALAADPADCSAGQYANAINASGTLTCAQVAYSQVSGTPAAVSAPFSDATAIVKNAADATKLVKIDASGVTTGNTVTLTAGGTAGAPTLAIAGHLLPTQIDFGATAGSASAPLLRMYSDGRGLFAAAGGVGFTPNGTNFPAAISSAGFTVNAAGGFQIAAPGDLGSADGDISLRRDAAGVFQICGPTFGTSQGSVKLIDDVNGSSHTNTATSELLTLSTSGTTTPTVGNLAAANSDVEVILARVTTTITTATAWGVKVTSGITSCTTAWVLIGTTNTTSSTMTAGTTAIFKPTAGTVCHVGTASTITVTTTGTPGAGAIRLTPVLKTYTAPTS